MQTTYTPYRLVMDRVKYPKLELCCCLRVPDLSISNSLLRFFKNDIINVCIVYEYYLKNILPNLKCSYLSKQKRDFTRRRDFISRGELIVLII